MGCIPSKLKKQHLSAKRGSPPTIPLEADGAETQQEKASSDLIANNHHAREQHLNLQKDINVPPPSGIINGPPADHHDREHHHSKENIVSSNKLKIYIIYYSMYGHEEALAKKVKDGVESIDGLEGHLFRVPELLVQTNTSSTSAEFEEVKAGDGTMMMNNKGGFGRDESIPTISEDEMVNADGFVFGFPTQFGAMAAQMKAFLDSTVSLWKGQKLAGKPAGVFVSSPSQGGGQEATVWNCISQLAHHGMLYVPIGYTFGAGMFKMDEIRGGSPFGAGTYTLDDGTRSPSDTELALAEHQGKYIAGLVKKLRSC